MSDLRIDDFPPDLHRELRVEAALMDMSLRETVLVILRQHVERRQALQRRTRGVTEDDKQEKKGAT